MSDINGTVEMFKQLQMTFKAALRDFDASAATFKILQSVPQGQVSSCRTLYVLDSSFNPPSKAHALLAVNAVQNDRGRQPVRLLLLLATVNADKAMKPAAFEDRIVMMKLMAETLHRKTSQVPIDIGVTKKPFFVDKAQAIDGSGIYGDTEQVHLTGFDTITRIFDSKYYPADKKLRVLEPFLSKHRLRVNYRLGDKYGDQEDQDEYLEGITDGSREHEGMKSEWRERVDMVNDAQDGIGVSSTQARKATVAGSPEKLDNYVDEAVSKYMTAMNLYAGKDTEQT